MLAAQDRATLCHGLVERVREARRHSDELFRLVRTDSLYERPIPERHRLIFYIGHLEAFDWNLLHENIFGLQPFHPEFDRLFAFGIDPVGGGLPRDQPSDWPSLEAVHDYVSRIRSVLDEKLASDALESGAPARGGFSRDTLLHVAIEHRLMHVETLAYMLHQLPLDKKIRPGTAQEVPATSMIPRMVAVPAGATTLGLRRDSQTFGWDNEFEAHSVNVPAFSIDRYKVSNRHYLEFLQAGGYETRDFWTDEDWNWKEAHGIFHPAFWRRTADGWLYRGMFDEVPLPLDWPVYVSHAEANAYAKWAGKSLPSEAEWHRAAYGASSANGRMYPWGSQAPTAARGNFDLRRWDPAPVNAFPEGDSGFGIGGMLGNGWEWTSTVFSPFPGFKPFSFYPGYSANFFDGRHFVMKGGSARTAACMLRPTFRNWFQAHYQYVYAGFRCVSHERVDH